MNVLNKSFVKSAKNWLELSKASKIKLESNGLPETVINDLNFNAYIVRHKKDLVVSV